MELTIILSLLCLLAVLVYVLVQETLYKLYPWQFATRALAQVDYHGRIVAIDADNETVMVVLEIHKTKLQFLR